MADDGTAAGLAPAFGGRRAVDVTAVPRGRAVPAEEPAS